MDDLIIYGTSLQDHMIILKVFQRLRETNYKVQLDKSEFLKKGGFSGQQCNTRRHETQPIEDQSPFKPPDSEDLQRN